MYDQKNTRPEGRVPIGKQKNHSNGVFLVLRQNHLVSLISAAAEERSPAKIVANRIAMARLWRAGRYPSGTGLLRPSKWSRRWSTMEVEM